MERRTLTFKFHGGGSSPYICAARIPRSIEINENPLPSLRQILLVEDTEDDAFFFRHSLGQTGVLNDLTHVVDGGEALEFLAMVKARPELRPDIIFLDLKLPKYSGFEILTWIESQKFEPPLRITVLSGSDHPGDIASARDLGVSDYVVKPISAAELKRRLLNAIPQEDQTVDALNQPCP